MNKRCDWAKSSLDIEYHDNFWGVPQYEDDILFEMLILEGMQAGLSWTTVLAKREDMRKAFDGFSCKIIAEYNEEKLQKLLQDKNIIRNRAKVYALPLNAKAFIQVQKDFGSFSKYIWSFVNDKPIQNMFKALNEIPSKTDISEKMSKDLLNRGFKFVGPTICYAFMQAIGMTNDHLISCKEHDKCLKMG